MKYIVCIICLVEIGYSIETEADEVSIDTGTNTYILSGNAVVSDDNKTFRANRITVQKSKNETKINANGNVLYKDGQNQISSNECESDLKTVVFKKNVVSKNKELGSIRSDNLIYDIKTKKINISMDRTSNKRVKLILDEKIESRIPNKSKP